MTNSKDVAAYVALDHLGYDVSIEGSGAVVVQVVEGSPADGVLETGDTIVAIDGETVELTEQVAEIVGSRAPGDTIVMTIEDSDGVTRDVEVTLAAREDDPDAGFLGVATVTRDLDFNLPIDVEIDSGNVGGPSAGLAFTLAILDVLTPGDLTGGDLVAVTGTIGPDSTVGAVGGVAQKVVAAAEAGAEVFIVPRSELEQATGAGADIRVEAVDDLDDALERARRSGWQRRGAPQPADVLTSRRRPPGRPEAERPPVLRRAVVPSRVDGRRFRAPHHPRSTEPGVGGRRHLHHRVPGLRPGRGPGLPAPAGRAPPGGRERARPSSVPSWRRPRNGPPRRVRSTRSRWPRFSARRRRASCVTAETGVERDPRQGRAERRRHAARGAG